MSENLDDRTRWLILQRKVAERRITELFRIFRQREIEPILIKGWAAGLKYDQPWERFFSDIDLAVDPSAYQKSLTIVRENVLEVDLHEGMRHHDTVVWNDLFDNSRLIAVDGGEIRILREEDHLRILCVHWLTDGGAFREKLLDIVYAVKNRQSDFDWGRCLATVASHRRKWIICTIGLAHRYYGLEIDDLPFADEARNIPVWLTKALEKEWNSGIRLLPLNEFLHDRRMLWKQILKRMPPNPIQAMVETESDLNDKTQVFNQLGSVAMRILPGLKRIYRTVKNSVK